jgi:hypothetical protein
VIARSITRNAGASQRGISRMSVHYNNTSASGV